MKAFPIPIIGESPFPAEEKESLQAIASLGEMPVFRMPARTMAATPADDGVLFIENVGNLVCPVAFDLGETYKVAILSVTEGEDKPLKYPDMFRAAGLLLLNKCDLLPYLRFDVELALENARRVNPNLRVIRISALTGEGFGKWLAWIEAGAATARRAAPEGTEKVSGSR